MPTAGPLPFLILALQLFSTGVPCLVSHRASARKKDSVNDQTLCVVIAGCCQSVAVFSLHLVVYSNLIFFFSPFSEEKILYLTPEQEKDKSHFTDKEVFQLWGL